MSSKIVYPVQCENEKCDKYKNVRTVEKKPMKKAIVLLLLVVLSIGAFAVGLKGKLVKELYKGDLYNGYTLFTVSRAKTFGCYYWQGWEVYTDKNGKIETDTPKKDLPEIQDSTVKFEDGQIRYYKTPGEIYSLKQAGENVVMTQLGLGTSVGNNSWDVEQTLEPNTIYERMFFYTVRDYKKWSEELKQKSKPIGKQKKERPLGGHK